MGAKLEAVFVQGLIWMLILIPVIALGSCVISMFRPPSEEQIASRAVTEAEIVVKNNLKDPDSAQFGEGRYTGKAVCGLVNAKNSFGGYSFLPGGNMRLWAPHQIYHLKGTSENPIGQNSALTSDVSVVSCDLSSAAEIQHPLLMAQIEIAIPRIGERLI